MCLLSLVLFLCMILHTMWSVRACSCCCEDSIGSVYVGRYCGLNESKLCVFSKLCPVDFLVFCERLSVLLQSVVISCVDLVMMGKWSDDSAY